MGFLTGKTAIITGAGRAVLSDGRCGSIGYGIATAYAKEGANLVITGRNAPWNVLNFQPQCGSLLHGPIYLWALRLGAPAFHFLA